jgi:hypothetical protein
VTPVQALGDHHADPANFRALNSFWHTMRYWQRLCRSFGLGNQRDAIRIILWHVRRCRWLRHRRSPVPTGGSTS